MNRGPRWSGFHGLATLNEMSHIEFKWLAEAYGDRGELAITVDGEPLPELLRNLEERFASQPGEQARPGYYSGMRCYGLMKSVVWQYQGRRGSHFWSGPHDKTALLACRCGEVACWPLMARVALVKDTVLWSDFEQPHRSRESPATRGGRLQVWDYGDYSLRFDRRQYMESLRSADAAVQQWRRSQSV